MASLSGPAKQPIQVGMKRHGIDSLEIVVPITNYFGQMSFFYEGEGEREREAIVQP